MTLEAAKKMDRGCVTNWLYDVYLNPAEAFNTYSYEQQTELAHDAIVLLREREPVKHGRWIPMYELTREGVLPDEPMGYMCDQCKAKRKKRLNYCSNCGAIMDGGGDGER